MKTTCLVNNYNYAAFIGEALESIFAQTRPFDEVIVVDDGSTDSSLEIIRAVLVGHNDVRVISKSNDGQLSCFNEGFAAASGDLIFFLDADDLFRPGYLEAAVGFYERNDECDFLCCAVHEFGAHDIVKNYIDHYCEDTGDIGFSLLRTLYGQKWIGSATSSLSMRRAILAQFLPLPFTRDWITNADDCLVYGASLVGARKFCLPEPLVEYRVHDANNWFGKSFSKSHKFKKRLKIQRMMQYIVERNYCRGDLDALILREFRTVPQPDLETARFYLGLLRRSRLFPDEKREIRNKIIRKYLKTQFARLRRPKH